MLSTRDYINSLTFFGVMGLLLRSLVQLSPVDDRTTQMSWLALRILSFGIPAIIAAVILIAATVRSGTVKREEVNSWLGLLVCLPIASLATMAFGLLSASLLWAATGGLAFAISRWRITEHHRFAEELALAPMVLGVYAATQVMMAFEHQVVLAVFMAAALILAGRATAYWWIGRSPTTRRGNGRGGEETRRTPPTAPGPNYAEDRRRHAAQAAAHSAIAGDFAPHVHLKMDDTRPGRVLDLIV